MRAGELGGNSLTETDGSCTSQQCNSTSIGARTKTRKYRGSILGGLIGGVEDIFDAKYNSVKWAMTGVVDSIGFVECTLYIYEAPSADVGLPVLYNLERSLNGSSCQHLVHVIRSASVTNECTYVSLWSGKVQPAQNYPSWSDQSRRIDLNVCREQINRGRRADTLMPNRIKGPNWLLLDTWINAPKKNLSIGLDVRQCVHVKNQELTKSAVLGSKHEYPGLDVAKLQIRRDLHLDHRVAANSFWAWMFPYWCDYRSVATEATPKAEALARIGLSSLDESLGMAPDVVEEPAVSDLIGTNKLQDRGLPTSVSPQSSLACGIQRSRICNLRIRTQGKSNQRGLFELADGSMS